MATNTAALKTFAQQTRAKLISLIQTKLQFVLQADSAELRGFEVQIDKLRKEIAKKTEKIVIEEVAYTWFNRVMALRFMDANGYNAPMIVSAATGQTRPEILQDAMGGNIDDELRLSDEDKLLPEAKLYRRLLIAVCNQKSDSMPFLFERIADYSELLLPDDLLSEQSFFSDIRQRMTNEDCQNVELMGWLYQFYIIDRKADAETKKSKKGGLKSDEQAAATQLFTPHWVVRYMVENSLGKIWMTLHPESSLINEMPYYIKSPEGQVDPIPEDIHSASDIRFIDPCMGSGHVLVYAFDLFTKMYEEEGEPLKNIPGLILTNNIFGIDIDPRCYQLASFALTMKARAYYSRYLRHTVSPNVIALQNVDYDTIESVGNWDEKSLMWQFENVDTIGSLLKITPKECAAIKVDSSLFGANQQVLKRQAEFLSGSYHCVVTNPPYLGKGFCDALSNFLRKEYANSKADTMVAFMERCMEFCAHNGKMAMINLPSWMFLSSFEKLRNTLLEKCHIESLVHMGRGIFGIDWGSVAFAYSKAQNNNTGCFFRLHARNFQHIYFTHIGQLFLQVLKNHNLKYNFSSYRDDDVANIEVFDFRHSDNGLKLYYESSQKNFEKIPGCPIGYWVSESTAKAFSKGVPLGNVHTLRQGMATGDNSRFIREWFEVDLCRSNFISINKDDAFNSNKKWFPIDKGGGFRKWYGLNSSMVCFDKQSYDILKTMGNKCPSESLYFFNGFTWGKITSAKFSIRYSKTGSIFSDAGMKIIFKESPDFIILALLNSKVIPEYLKIFSETINFEKGNLAKIPLIGDNKHISNEIIQQNITISKQDWDAHEISWDFLTNEIVALRNQFKEKETRKDFKLSALVSEYEARWENKFMQLHTNEEELNRQFIDIYGLQDELTPDVPLNEITILQKGEISIEDNKIIWHEDVVIKQLISYLVGCYMGRYSVDKPGLIIASQGQDLSSLGLEMEGLAGSGNNTIAIDDDGIIPFIQEQDFFADNMTERIEMAIKKIFGKENYYDNLKYINDALGGELREYLFKSFYADHVQMYKRPIYWLFSSKMGDKKKKGYFKAMVYMHRIENDTLSKLHADYVHPYIEKVERQLREAEDEATRDDLSTAQRNKALKRSDELKDKVREVRAFEQQLVEMASHRLTIDLDDGVKTNYPKYYPLVEPIKGLESSEE